MTMCDNVRSIVGWIYNAGATTANINGGITWPSTSFVCPGSKLVDNKYRNNTNLPIHYVDWVQAIKHDVDYHNTAINKDKKAIIYDAIREYRSTMPGTTVTLAAGLELKII